MNGADCETAPDEESDIWFFVDTELEKASQWDSNMKCLEDILKVRKSDPIKIRLLMTTCCAEYWFLLHYDRRAPALATPADAVRHYVPLYEKGDYKTTAEIAQNYEKAIQNGYWTLERLKSDGLPEDLSERDRWLYEGSHTFTTVHEALEMLKELPRL